MDLREELTRLDEPDPRAVERVWSRFERTRSRQRRPLLAAGVVAATGLVATAAAAALVTLSWPEQSRTLELDAQGPQAHVWSEQVSLDADGSGDVSGTDRDVSIDWRSGRVRIHVAANTGTALRVLTDEATVEVIGTILTVDRDALGVTVAVEKGRVRVSCRDGWTGDLTPATGSHTCLPITPAGLLGRADALLDRGGSHDEVLQTLDRGVATAATGSPVMGELLVRRMRQRAELDVDGALADAERYLATDAADRATEVRRFAGWLALSRRGCTSALPWLSALHEAGSAEESVLLAECIAPEDPSRARTLLLGALPMLDSEWSARAAQDLAALPQGAP